MTTHCDTGVEAPCGWRPRACASMISLLVMLSGLCGFAGQPKATTGGVAAASGAGTPVKQARTWSVADKLPLLTPTLIRPIKNAAEFSVEGDSMEYPREPKPSPPTERPFEKDGDAVAAARAWITAHFGKLPPDISLKVDRINHSSSGRDKPAFDWDHGHTISFCECYHGIPTDSFAIIYITGRTKFAATLGLHAFSPIPGTAKRIVGRSAALKAWQDRIKERGYNKAVLAKNGFEKDAKPRLVYVWSKVQYVRRHSDVIAPTWALGHENLFMVDGHTGVAWFND